MLKEIDNNLGLLKRHLPYHESDHVANMAYNILAGEICLENIELLRKNPALLDALGGQIIPDPTTAGDFLRRFEEQDVLDFMSAKNNIRKKKMGKTAGVIQKDGYYQCRRQHQRNIRSMQAGYGYLIQRQIQSAASISGLGQEYCSYGIQKNLSILLSRFHA